MLFFRGTFLGKLSHFFKVIALSGLVSALLTFECVNHIYEIQAFLFLLL